MYSSNPLISQTVHTCTTGLQLAKSPQEECWLCPIMPFVLPIWVYHQLRTSPLHFTRIPPPHPPPESHQYHTSALLS